MSSQPPSKSATTQVEFAPLGRDTYEAQLPASEPNTPLEGFKRLFLGQPIAQQFAGKERLNRSRALAILSSDALSSVAYGTEASLSVLVAAGAVALGINLWLGLAIAALMLIVANSYRQTIRAYPNGGGSYIVARENLGTLSGLIAAAALLVDYLLTVAVSVAAGINAIASAIPAITPWRVWLDLGAILLITVVNLRGLRESGSVFAIPTYLFLISFGLMIAFGLAHAVTHGGLTANVPPPTTAFPGATQAITVMLVLTAFASGCSAMTGVEAISNGVQIFEGETPEQRATHARQTLVVMIILLATFYLGTTFLAWRLGIAPDPAGQPTVTAQIAQIAFTGAWSWLFYVVQVATLLILIFAANTSFNGFPLLAAFLANDNFAPALFAYRGERLALTVGITTLGALSALVLWIFQGNVVDLINLYALGVFTAFTLSQTGMVVHWARRRQERGWRSRIVANGVGALATAVVTAVIAIAKFDRGAWVVLILIPLLVMMGYGIRRYYERPRIIDITALTPTQHADVAIVPIFSHKSPLTQPNPRPGSPHGQAWTDVLEKELAFAHQVAPNVQIVRVTVNAHEKDDLRNAWTDFVAHQPSDIAAASRVVTIVSPYRTVVLPFVNFVCWERDHELSGKRIAVILPREAGAQFWEWPLRRMVASRVRDKLQSQRDVAVLDLPYRLGSARHKSARVHLDG